MWNKIGETNNKFILNNFYPVTSYRRVEKESDELLCVYGLYTVTRYGPQSVASASAGKSSEYSTDEKFAGKC